MQTGSQILADKGNANLGFGTAGSLASGAPIGVIDIKDNGFDNLARLTFLKDKQVYDAKKKEEDDMFAALKNVDLNLEKMLDNDRQSIIDNRIDPIVEFLTKKPYSLNPKTPQQIQDNLELKKMLSDLNNDKAKAAVRYNLKGVTDKSIAGNTFDRDEENNWYTKQFAKPLEYITPRGTVYNFEPVAGEDEEVVTDLFGDGDTKNKSLLKTNFNTSLNKNRQLYDTMPNVKAYIDKLYLSNADTDNALRAKKQAALDKANQIIDPVERDKAIAEVNKLPTTYVLNEINTYNNYASDVNEAQSHLKNPKPKLPLIDPTKPLSTQQFLDVYVANKVVKQSKLEQSEDVSEFFKLKQLAAQKAEEQKTERLKAAYAAAKNGTAAGTDYLSIITAPFTQKSEEQRMFESGKNGEPGFMKYNQNSIKGEEKVYIGKKAYENQEVVEDKASKRRFTEVEGTLYEYNEGSKKWNEVPSSNIALPDILTKRLGTEIISTEIKSGNKLKIVYKDKAGEEHTVIKDPETIFKDFLEGNQKGYTATKALLKAQKPPITNLNDPAQFKRAVKIVQDQIDAETGNEPPATEPGNEKVNPKTGQPLILK